ncbi:MAG: DUF3800 domain-containing protein [Smithella sp.]
MSLTDQHAFIDEFGNSNLDIAKEGVSTHFIVSAVIVDEHKIPLLEEKLDIIRKKYFQTGDIKSRKVGKDDSKRSRILNELSELDFHIFAVVVDKAKLHSEGFRHRHVFYKYLHSLVDGALYRTYPNLKISADQYGTKEFMDGFCKYIENNHIPDLFNQADFCFVPSNSSLLVQLADFICGTLARHFDYSVKSENSPDFISILKKRILYVVPWPEESKTYLYESPDEKSEYDETIATQSLNLANLFISQYEDDKDPTVRDRVNCLKFLLFYFRFVNPHKYVTTRELKSHISYDRITEISSVYLRSNIIAKLRDSRVLISSSPKGYKLPVNMNDIYDFINHSNAIIFPMLDRLEKCRKEIKLATKNGLDIFDRSDYISLKSYFDYIR